MRPAAAGSPPAADCPKPLLDLNGKPLVRHVIDAALTVCGRCIVVTGYRATEMERALQGIPGVVTAYNRDYRRGMFSSILAGAQLVESSWFFVAPADMPFLPPEVFRVLLAAAAGSARRDGPLSFFPSYRGRTGHPVLISRELLSDGGDPAGPRDAAGPGDPQAAPGPVEPAPGPVEPAQATMKAFVSRFPQETVPVTFAEILRDLDTPDALREARDRRDDR